MALTGGHMSRHLSHECGDGRCMCWRWPAAWRLMHLVTWRRHRFHVVTALAEAFGVHARQVRWSPPPRRDDLDDLDELPALDERGNDA